MGGVVVNFHAFGIGIDDEQGQPGLVIGVAAGASGNHQLVCLTAMNDGRFLAADHKVVAVLAGSGLYLAQVITGAGFVMCKGHLALAGSDRRQVLVFLGVVAHITNQPAG